MKRIICIIMCAVIGTIFLSSCKSGQDSSVHTTKYKSTYSTSEVTDMLLNSVGSTDPKGKSYTYINIGTYETDDDSFYIFKWCTVNTEDTTATFDLIQYIFVSYDAKKAYKGNYNEESGQATFGDSINLNIY